MPQLTVITTLDLAPGFALTGASVFVAEDADEGERLLRQRMEQTPDGVIAYHAPFFEELSQDLRDVVLTQYQPLVLPLPDGLPARGEVSRRQQLAEMLRQVIGYSISFREGEARAS